MKVTIGSWQTACDMMLKEKKRLKSYIQWYPFYAMDENTWSKIRSREFYEHYIKDMSFLLVDSMRFVSNGLIQKEGVDFRRSSLVSPILFLYILSVGVEFSRSAELPSLQGAVLYSGNLKRGEAHYRKSYKIFCDYINQYSINYQYCVKTDISDFFGSINVDLLLDNLQEYSKDADEPFDAIDAVSLRGLLLYCGAGRFPVVQNCSSLSYFATCVYLNSVDRELECALSKIPDITEFQLVRYVDDLYVFFDVANEDNSFVIFREIVSIYSELLRKKWLHINPRKCAFIKAEDARIMMTEASSIDYQGEAADWNVSIESDQIVRLFNRINALILHGKYSNETFEKSVEDIFSASDSPVTAIQVFRKALYNNGKLFQVQPVIQAIKSASKHWDIFLTYHTQEIVVSVTDTRDEALIKSFLNGLFQASRTNRWSPALSLAAVTYLLHRGMQHNDLLKVLKDNNGSVYSFCVRYCLPGSNVTELCEREKSS